jgi:hypothetical protein
MNTLRTLRAAVMLLAFATIAAAQVGPNNTVFKKAFDAILKPDAVKVLNIGQQTHSLTVLLPTATADVTGLQIRIEASFDDVTWFPISTDITTATYTAGTGAMATVRANGSFPYIRARAIAVASNDGYPLTAHYTGATQPLGNTITDAGRLLTEAPESPRYQYFDWYCQSCSAGQQFTAGAGHQIIMHNAQMEKCTVTPFNNTGTLTLRLTHGGSVQEVFSGYSITTAGTSRNHLTTFTTPTLTEGSELRLHIDAVTGGTTNVAVRCRAKILSTSAL